MKIRQFFKTILSFSILDKNKCPFFKNQNTFEQQKFKISAKNDFYIIYYKLVKECYSFSRTIVTLDIFRMILFSLDSLPPIPPIASIIVLLYLSESRDFGSA